MNNNKHKKLILNTNPGKPPLVIRYYQARESEHNPRYTPAVRAKWGSGNAYHKGSANKLPFEKKWVFTPANAGALRQSYPAPRRNFTYQNLQNELRRNLRNAVVREKIPEIEALAKKIETANFSNTSLTLNEILRLFYGGELFPNLHNSKTYTNTKTLAADVAASVKKSLLNSVNKDRSRAFSSRKNSGKGRGSENARLIKYRASYLDANRWANLWAQHRGQLILDFPAGKKISRNSDWGDMRGGISWRDLYSFKGSTLLKGGFLAGSPLNNRNMARKYRPRSAALARKRFPAPNPTYQYENIRKDLQRNYNAAVARHRRRIDEFCKLVEARDPVALRFVTMAYNDNLFLPFVKGPVRYSSPSALAADFRKALELDYELDYDDNEGESYDLPRQRYLGLYPNSQMSKDPNENWNYWWREPSNKVVNYWWRKPIPTKVPTKGS